MSLSTPTRKTGGIVGDENPSICGDVAAESCMGSSEVIEMNGGVTSAGIASTNDKQIPSAEKIAEIVSSMGAAMAEGFLREAHLVAPLLLSAILDNWRVKHCVERFWIESVECHHLRIRTVDGRIYDPTLHALKISLLEGEKGPELIPWTSTSRAQRRRNKYVIQVAKLLDSLFTPEGHARHLERLFFLMDCGKETINSLVKGLSEDARSVALSCTCLRLSPEFSQYFD
jgi:hypothetical protein